MNSLNSYHFEEESARAVAASIMMEPVARSTAVPHALVFVTAAVVCLILAVAAVTATAAVLSLAAFFVLAAFSVVFPSAAVAVVVPVAAAPFALEIDRVAALEAEDTLQHHMVLDMACVH